MIRTGITQQIRTEVTKLLLCSSKMHGSSVVLQTRFKSVVLPALARPMTRIRKCLYFCRRSTASCKLLMLVVVVQGKEMVSIDKDSSLVLIGTKESRCGPKQRCFPHCVDLKLHSPS